MALGDTGSGGQAAVGGLGAEHDGEVLQVADEGGLAVGRRAAVTRSSGSNEE
jgi:hypothetical protein